MVDRSLQGAGQHQPTILGHVTSAWLNMGAGPLAGPCLTTTCLPHCAQAAAREGDAAWARIVAAQIMVPPVQEVLDGVVNLIVQTGEAFSGHFV